MSFSSWVTAIKLMASYWKLNRKLNKFRTDLAEALRTKVKAGESIHPIDFGHGTALLTFRDTRKIFVPETKAMISGEAQIFEIKPYPNDLFGCFDWMPSAVTFPVVTDNGTVANGILCINALMRAWLHPVTKPVLEADPYKTRVFSHLVARSILLHEYGHVIRAQDENSTFRLNPNRFVRNEQEEIYADIIAACNAGLFGMLLYLFEMDIILRLMWLCDYIQKPVMTLASIRTRARPLILMTLPDLNEQGMEAVISLWAKTVAESLDKHAQDLQELACYLTSGSTNLITGTYGTLADAICKAWPRDLRDILDLAITNDNGIADELIHKENPEAKKKFGELTAQYKERHPDWFDKSETSEQQHEKAC